MMKRTKYYHVDEAAELLGITPNEVRVMLNRKELKGHKQGRRWLVDMAQPHFERLENSTEAIKVKQEPMFRFIKDAEHEEMFFKHLLSVKKSLYIATYDFKQIKIDGKDLVCFLKEMAKNGVKIIIKCKNYHTNEIEQNFEISVCERNHMKLFVFDEKIAYIGSGNLTPAALKKRKKRTINHEAGILTTDPNIIRQAIEHFHSVSLIEDCRTCRRQCKYRKADFQCD